MSIELADIEFVSRRRHRIMLGMKGNHSYVEFSCSRLHGEDMFDELTTRLEDLGIRAKRYEHET